MNTFRPLENIRVLDFSKVLAGPLCTQYLGDLGADVVKVEAKDHGDDTRHWPPLEGDDGTIFLSVNRNKRSIALDLKSPAGKDIIRKLVTTADVVIESFGPGVAKRLSVDYEHLSAINEKIIYSSISGYGTQGPMNEGKGYDVVLQAFSGMLSITGEPGGEAVRSPFSPVDQGTGLHATIGILAGLLERGRSGKGLRVDASLFDTSVAFLGYILQGFWQKGSEPERPGSGHESLCPYQVFETQDKPVILGVANDSLWRAFCTIAEEPELATREGFATNADRVANRAATVTIVDHIMRKRTRETWIKILGAGGVPCSPVHNLGELTSHPHTAASGMIFDYHKAPRAPLKGVAQPLRFDGKRQTQNRPPPLLGEHSVELLTEIGYSNAEIENLLNDGVVGTNS
ncbi:MAG: CaiB/BaiF CoA transferase family protein [Gammaproteobacteria bacterium]